MKEVGELALLHHVDELVSLSTFRFCSFKSSHKISKQKYLILQIHEKEEEDEDEEEGDFRGDEEEEALMKKKKPLKRKTLAELFLADDNEGGRKVQIVETKKTILSLPESLRCMKEMMKRVWKKKIHPQSASLHSLPARFRWWLGASHFKQQFCCNAFAKINIQPLFVPCCYI